MGIPWPVIQFIIPAHMTTDFCSAETSLNFVVFLLLLADNGSLPIVYKAPVEIIMPRNWTNWGKILLSVSTNKSIYTINTQL